MAVAAAAATTFNITSSTTRRLTNPTIHFPLSLHASNTRTRRGFPILIHCSTRPDIESNNATNKTPIVENGSNSVTQEAPTSSSNKKSSFSSSIGLVLDLGSKGTWDSHEIGSPVVKRFLSDDEERWYMWYHGNSDGGSDLIGLAVSGNGVHWEKGSGPVRSNADVGLVMNCSKDWWAFDTEGIRPSEVVIMSSSKVRASSAVYWLYYSGINPEKVEFSVASKVLVQNPERAGAGDKDLGIFKSLPGLAISQDGRHWARIEGEHHSGALFDVGADSEWDSLFIAGPQVVFHSSGDLRMYYHSFDATSGEFAIGLARSRDGIKWVKLGKVIGGGGSVGAFDELGVMNAHVVKNQKDGGYVMAYEGIAVDGGRSIGLAVSQDGLKDWRRCGDEAALEPSVEEDVWDNNGVGSPCLVQMDGKDNEWRLYYRGIGREGKTGIGLAVSEGGDIKSFRRWTGFHL